MGRKESDGSGDEFDKATYVPEEFARPPASAPTHVWVIANRDGVIWRMCSICGYRVRDAPDTQVSLACPWPPAAPQPVCETCQDTHLMWMHNSSGDLEQVMCTRCPTPCEGCRSRGPGQAGGPYCATTPCACACHPFNAEAIRQSIDEAALKPAQYSRAMEALRARPVDPAIYAHAERCVRASDPVKYPVISCSCDGGTKARRARVREEREERAHPLREKDEARDAQLAEAVFGRKLLRVIYPQTPTGPIPEATWLLALAQLEVLAADARAKPKSMPAPIRSMTSTDAIIANLRSAFGALFARAPGPSESMRAHPAISGSNDGLVGVTMWPAEAKGFVAVVQELIHLAARVEPVPATPPAPPEPPAAPPGPPPIVLGISDRALHQTLANVLDSSHMKDRELSELRGRIGDLEALAHELVEIADDASSALPPNAQDRWDELVAKVRG